MNLVSEIQKIQISYGLNYFPRLLNEHARSQKRFLTFINNLFYTCKIEQRKIAQKHSSNQGPFMNVLTTALFVNYYNQNRKKLCLQRQIIRVEIL